MASDEIIWDIINNQHCSYKVKTTKNQNFCRNEYNVSGYCSKQACPLANSRYATIRPDKESGRLYLYMKTIERAHMPSRWWERIKLSGDYSKALAQIDTHLIYWPKFLLHRCKQRLTRLTQVAIRTRKITLEEQRLGERLVPRLAPKVRRREATRERKAEVAANVDRATERVLLDRIRNRVYGEEPLNIDEKMFKKIMQRLEREEKGEQENEVEEEFEDEVEWENEHEGALDQVEYVSDIEGDSEEEADLEELEDFLGSDSMGEYEDASEEGDEEQDGGFEEESKASEEEDDGSDQQKLQRLLGNYKRKRPSEPSTKPNKRSTKSTKGPKRLIEYVEEEPLKEAPVLA